jgi:predicted DNA-binding transcriptional regulator AlpA
MSKTLSVATPLTPQVTIPTKRFLSEIELEASFGIPRKTLQNWRMLGRGPLYRKFGNSVRYDVGDVETWIQALPTGGAGVPSCAVGGR